MGAKTRSNKRNTKKAMGMTMAAAVATASLIAPALTTPVQAAEPTVDAGKTSVQVSNKWFGEKQASKVVELLANGEKVADITLNDANGWSHTFADLPATDQNGPIVYSVREANTEGYLSEVSGDASEGFTVVNLELPTHAGFAGATDDIDVTKSWIGDAGNQARINLLVDGYEIDSVVLDAQNDWKHVFDNMPIVENEQGQPVTYTVAEPVMDGYDTKISGNRAQGFIVSNIEAAEAPVEGSIVTKYVDASGKEIAFRQTLSGTVGDKYELAQKEIPGYAFKSVTGDAKGEFKFGVNEVVYVYDKVSDVEYVEGQVVAKYVDATGKEIALRSTVSGEVGKDFKVDPKAIPGYAYQKTEGANIGKYEAGIKTVTFVYKEDVQAQAPLIGGVIVKYVDSNGKEISDRVAKSGKVGEDYKTEWKTIPGYGLMSVSSNANGKFSEGISIVTYTYGAIKDEGNFEDGGNVVVKYTDEEGNEIAARERLAGKPGESYSSSKKTIQGYEFVRVAGEATGKYGDKTKVVEYIYKKTGAVDAVKEGQVTVKYLDTDGRQIAEPIVMTGKQGEKYKATQKDISGYTFKQVKGYTDGTYSATPAVTEYIYSKNESVETPLVEGLVTVKYVDMEGNEIVNPTSVTGKVGADYAVTSKAIEGYVLVKVDGPKNGKFANGATTVKFVYDKVDTGSVTPPVVKPDAKPNAGGTDNSVGTQDGGTVSGNGNVSKEPNSKYKNCTELTKDYPDGVKKGHPEYREKFDRDKDGQACEAGDVGTAGTLTESGNSNITVSGDPNVNPDGTLKNPETVTSTSNVTTNQPSKESLAQTVDPQGKELASTATNTFNFMAIGATLLALAGGAFFFLNRRKPESDSAE